MVMLPISPCAPTINTIIQEKIRTTIVRIAVATPESVFLIPHFARMDVNPASNADKKAYNNHMVISLLSSGFSFLFYHLTGCLQRGLCNGK